MVLEYRVVGRIYGSEGRKEGRKKERKEGRKKERKEGRKERHNTENRITEGFVP
jgi:hypothetical protein